ncbi:prolyl oligopeptidase family serine peptidase [Nocardia sp. ET3-3]|uniref:Prolyl oligopeptidase family serine peptidase n=1 Tax=Nocardia terrae TaxID=2675851 RepID=A0A7K1V068_9NOCA|nr:PHB depolymerase family esterase [Nocardia terrae]MVU80036.1 prolyl oligopeptidase family serine peptidase [Nocardia terrae]
MKLRNAVSALAIASGLAAITASVVTAAVPTPTPGSLQGYNISATYVAGVSSGGYMANQLHVAYSGTFKGAGIFTAGPYDCAQDNVSTALESCMNTHMARKTPAQLEQETKDRANAGTVDPVSGLSGSKVYLYHGTSDTTVAAAVNDDLATYYRDLGANVVYNNSTAAGHSWVSPLGPVSCSTTASPFINNCDNDPEHDMLAQLLGNVKPAGASALTGKLIQFDQGQYTGGSAGSISMDDKGFAYVPSSCASGTSCTLLVALHGCKQGYSFSDSNGTIGDTFMKDANLNEYADTNDIIVLYPQAITTTGSNPQGCWDWWGYTNNAYAEHNGPQMKAIMSMVTALTTSTPPTSTTTSPTTTTTPPTSTTAPPTSTTPAPICITDSNYNQTVAGRAHQNLGETYANGSDQDLGLWNTYNMSSLKQTSPGYWEKC